MRKLLLGTTAVVGAALLGATAAQAQTAPTVRVGGFMVTQMTYSDDDVDKASLPPTGVAGAGGVSRDKIDFKNEVQIQVFVTGKAANGMSYGAVIEIQNDGTGGTVFDIDEAYTFISSPTLGTIRFGEEDSAASLLQVRHPTIAVSGAGGDWGSSLLSNNAFTGGGPSLASGINDGNDATKIIYLSPQFFGFDFGVSYTPNRNEGDRVIGGRALDSISVTAGSALAPTSPQRDPTGLTNEISGGLRYRGSFGNVGFQTSLTAMRADAGSVNNAGAPITDLRDVRAYSAGAQISAFGFTLGGEYSWGNYSGSVGTTALVRRAGAEREASSMYALGLTYVAGAWSFGGFYSLAEQDTNTVAQGKREQQTYGVSIAYTLAPGLDIYSTWAQLKDENVFIRAGGGTLDDRDANAFLLGTRIAF